MTIIRIYALFLIVGAALALSNRLATTQVSGQIGSGGLVLNYEHSGSIGLRLTSITRQSSGSTFEFAPTVDLWEFGIIDPQSKVVTILRPGNTARSGFTLSGTLSSLRATWQGVTTPLSPSISYDIVVDIKIDATADAALFNISIVDNKPPYYSIFFVNFPNAHIDLGSLSQFPAQNQILAVPRVYGTLINDPVDNLDPNKMFGPNDVHPHTVANDVHSMQFVALYDERNGESDPTRLLYFATHDPARRSRSFAIDTLKPLNAIQLTVQDLPPDNMDPTKTASYSIPYPTAISVLDGDWMAAADFYRSWALSSQADWMSAGPMHASTSFSHLVREANMLYYHAGDASYWEKEVREQKEHFLGGQASEHPNKMPTIYALGWHPNTPVTCGTGDWTPISATFVAGAAALTASHDVFAPFFLNDLYDTSIPSYFSSYLHGYIGTGVEPHGVLEFNGTALVRKKRVEFCLMPPTPALFICAGTSFAKDYTDYWTTELVTQTQARGLYMDVSSGRAPEACYDASHGHPTLGGGDWYNEAKVDLIESIRLASGLGDFYITTETNNEMWIAHDGKTLSEVAFFFFQPQFALSTTPVLRTIPMWDYVYHDYICMTRLGSNFKLPLSQPIPLALAQRLRQEYACGLHIGMRPWAGAIASHQSLADFLVAGGSDVQAYYSMIQKFMGIMKQVTVRDFVHFGRRRREPFVFYPANSWAEIDSAITTVLHQRPSIENQPAVYVSLWELTKPAGAAKTGSLGILILNWSAVGDQLPTIESPSNPVSIVPQSGKHSIAIQIKASDYGLTGAWELFQVTPQGSVFKMATHNFTNNPTFVGGPIDSVPGTAQFFYLQKV